MPAFEDLQEHFQDLIRKGLSGSVFVKRYAPADAEITKLKDGTGLLSLPTGYADTGYLTKDQGVAWSRDIDTSETTSLGEAEATRVDVTSDVSGLSFTMQESKRTVFELYEGQSLAGINQDANGNVTWDKPDRPATTYYRVLVLFKDGEGAEAMYFAKWGPRMQVTDRSEQSWGESDEVQYGVTLRGFKDPVYGTALRSLWAGPVTSMTRMGFPTAV
jgi:hypothetical protein